MDRVQLFESTLDDAGGGYCWFIEGARDASKMASYIRNGRT